MIKVSYDTQGNILGYYPGGFGYSSIPQPTIEIDEFAHQDCINNNGLRKVDIVNKIIVVYNPPALTAEEIKQQKLIALDAEYQPKFASLAQSVGLATLDGDQTVIDSIKSDYAALKAQYQTKKEAIVNG